MVDTGSFITILRRKKGIMGKIITQDPLLLHGQKQTLTHSRISFNAKCGCSQEFFFPNKQNTIHYKEKHYFQTKARQSWNPWEKGNKQGQPYHHGGSQPGNNFHSRTGRRIQIEPGNLADFKRQRKKCKEIKMADIYAAELQNGGKVSQ